MTDNELERLRKERLAAYAVQTEPKTVVQTYNNIPVPPREMNFEYSLEEQMMRQIGPEKKDPIGWVGLP